MLDWVHWGTYTEFAYDRKAGVAPLINDYTLLGNPIADYGPFQYGDNYNGYTWNDGVPTASITNSTTGVYLLGKNDGYQFTVPADATTRVLKVYVGAYGAGATFNASLSDGGSYTSTAVTYAGNGPAGLYTLTFAALSSNQTLTVKFTLTTVRDRNFGNVTLQAAALYYAVSNNPPTLAITNPAPNATFGLNNPISIGASAFDKDGTITGVQFFDGPNLIGESFTNPFAVTWNGAVLGAHSVTARATDNGGLISTSRPVRLFVTGTGGSLNASSANSSSNIVLSTEGTRDWTHWGLIDSSSFDRKNGVVPFLPNFQAVGTNIAQRTTEDFTQWSWTGGTPHLTTTNSTTGVYVNGYTNGFELQLPAGSNSRTAKVYVSLYGARGQIQAFLSDFSAPVFTDARESFYDKSPGTYTFSYAAASENQKLIVRYTADSLYDFAFGYITLLSSAAVAAPSTVNILTPTNNMVLDASTRILIQADAMNADGPITSVGFYHDGLLIGEVTNTPFRVIWSNAVPGATTLQAIATDVFGGVATSAPVALSIVTNIPSPVRLITPLAGDAFVAGTNVTLEAVADPPFEAQSVEFFAGDISLGQVVGPPFSMVWSNVPIGLYTLSAIATDSSAILISSPPAVIAVDPNKPPNVTVTTPTNGSIFHWSEPVLITASAFDVDGYITSLQIYDGETKLTECTNSPCTFVLSNNSSQVYSLTARATDNWLVTSTSAPVVVTITNLPPAINLTSPTNGATAWTAIPLLLDTETSDPDGTIQRVQFFEGTNLLGEVESPPFSLVWSNNIAGSFTFTAIATDNDGAPTLSSPVSIIVSNPAPAIAITNPIANVSFAKFTNILIEAQTSDLNGTVTNVAFFEGTNLIATVSSAPFSFLWTNVAPGSYVLTAQATDNEGASSVSAPINITVLNSSLTGDVLGSFQVLPEGTEVNLSQEGALDWMHWGTFTEFASDRKAGVPSLLKEYSLLGSPGPSEGPFQFGNGDVGYTWWDGTPNSTVSNTTSGIILTGLNHGFQLTVPSDTTTRVLKIYVGAYGADATISAYLSDGSGYASTEFNDATNGHGGVYTISYISASSNQLLTVKYLLTSVHNADSANISLQAAAISYATDTNNPPTIAVTSPAQNAIYTEGELISLNAVASDSDGTVTNVEFYVGTNFLGQTSEGPYAFTWANALPGQYTITANAIDNNGASYRSRPITVFVTSSNGVLSGSAGPTPASVVLSLEGSRDWAHWGRNGASSFDHKAGVPTFFTTFQKLGTNTVLATDDSTAWSWTGGTPSLNASNSMTGVFLAGYTNGFELQLPANTNLRTAKIYVGLASARGRLQAYLSDYSAPPFIDTSLASLYGNDSRGFTFNYASATNNQKLIVRYVADSIYDVTLGGVTLLSATAIAAPSSVTITNPIDGSLVDCSHPPQLQATASNPDGTISSVSFYRDGVLIGKVTNSPYNLIWTNGIPGSYILTASATDIFGGTTTSAPVAVTLTGNPLPSVSLTSPTGGAIFFEHTNITLNAQASDINGTISMVEFFAGTNSLGQDTNAPFSLIWSNVPAGSYALTAVATDNQGDSTISSSANITIVTNKWPLPRILSPTNTASFFTPSNVTIIATASDPDGFVTLLELFDGSTKVGQSTATNLIVTLTNPPVGPHVLTARATDNWFGSNVSASVTVVVTNPPPSISITNPVNGSTFLELTNITLRTRASDTNGTVSLVEFFADTNSLGIVTNAPFNLVWSNVPLGSYSLTAVAIDNEGVNTTSAPVNISVVTNKPPLVSVTAPTNGATFFSSSNFTVTATASDTDGAITLLELFDGAIKLTQSSNSPLSFLVTNASAGAHAFTARATDNWFGTNTSTPVLVNVTNPPPSIVITNPINGATLVEHTNVTIRARANDTNGTIAWVEFFVDTNSLGIVTNAPFNILWTNVALGSYALTAVAMDNEGSMTISTPVNVTVVTNKLPTVAITTPTNNATFFSSSNFTVNASALDLDGTITLLELFDGAVKLTQSSNSSLTFVVTNATAGTHTLTARATDNWLATTESQVVTVNVTNPSPTIAITNLINGATFLEHTNITLRARASDTNGTIAAVQFFADTNLLGIITNTPFSLIWSNVPLGSYSLTAIATDNEGASTLSAPIGITVVTNKLPTVAITTPTNGATFFSSSNFTVTASASDPDGLITLLELFDGTTKLSQVSNSSLSFIVTNASPGTHTLTVRATDNWFGTNVSSSVVVTITNPAPAIAITNLVDGATFFEHTNITLRAKASDTNGTVSLVEFFADTNLLGFTTNAPFTLTWSNVSIGAYSLTARATDNEGVSSLSTPITINVVANQLPTANLNSPTNGAIFSYASNITVTATASDPDGSITLLEIFDGVTKLSQSSGSSLNFIWTNASPGSHTLTARATDNWFATNTSASATITILSNLPPNVSIIAPTNGSTFISPSNITVIATASGINTSIKLLELFDGAAKLSQTTNTSMTFLWTNAAIGSHTLTARATDSQLVSNTSTPISITVTNPLPFVAITNPVNGNLFIEGSNVLIKAQANDVNGSVAKVEFFAGALRLGQTTNSPYNFTWSNVVAGDYLLSAWATDNNGASNVSTAVSITVTNPPPSVAITNPVDGALFLPNTNIVIRARASDTNGSVAKVEFFAGTNLLGQVTNSPYNFTWTNVPIGNYPLTAKATDNKGATNTSAAVGVTVSPNIAPTAGISSPANGAVFISPTNINITATGSDSDGAITLLEIFDSTNRLAQSTNSLLIFTWTNATIGFHSLTARATDNRAASTTSAGVVINVSNPPPSVVITNPVDGAKILTKSKITIQARATDLNGTVTKVQFYAGTKLLATLTSIPFNYSWNNAQPGSYVLTAIATDNNGATNRSPDVSITVARSFPALRDADTNGGLVYFDFPVGTELNQVYTVEFNDGFDTGDWQTLTNFLGTGDDVLVSDPLSTNQHRFYRVKVGSE